MSTTDEEENENAIDPVAREQIATLRKRLEGAHLVPGYRVIFRKAFQAVAEWAGWEIVGVGSTFFVGLAIVVLGFFALGKGCDSHAQTLQHDQVELTKEQFTPACEALGLTFVTVQSVQFVNTNGVVECADGNCTSVVEHIVCVGSDRVVTINARDISETETHIISNN